VVVALERRRALAVRDLADARVGVQQPAVRVEARGRLLLRRLRIEDHRPRLPPAERTGRLARHALDRDRALRRAVGVDHLAAEALREALEVVLRALVAERDLQRIIGVVGALGRGEDVGERLADVVEERDAVLPHVRQEARRREASAQRHRRAAVHGRSPAGHQLVRVEQRHRLVADVAAADAAVRADVPRDPGEALLGADRRLRLAGGAGGEDQQIGRARIERGVRVGCAGEGRERLAPARRIDDERALGGDAGVEPREEPRVALLRHDQRAVGVADVARQLRAAARRVDADDGRAGKGRRAEEERVLGDVVEQDADVEPRPARKRPPEGEQPRGALERRSNVRAPAPRFLLEAQRRRVVGGALAQQVPHRARRRRLGGGRHARILSQPRQPPLVEMPRSRL
jgi:hypothetical protein